MENKQTIGPSPQTVKSAINASSGITENSQNNLSIEEDLVFYNVMPKTSNTNTPLVSSKIKVQSSEIKPKNSKILEVWKKYYKFILGGVVIIILGVGTYFVINNFFSKTEEQSILVVNPQGSELPNESKGNNNEAENITLQPAWKEWLIKYFDTETCSDEKLCGPDADAENDGLNNEEEYNTGTDPNNKDSDQDGISDGDEMHVFLSNPLQSHTAKDHQYSDADFIIGAYNIINPANKYTPQELEAILERMVKYGLHQPTVNTVSPAVLENVYKYTSPAADEPQKENVEAKVEQSSLPDNIDKSASAKQDRDTQRSNTIKTISMALIKFHADRNEYPKTSDFLNLAEQIKPYNRVATNPIDPINREPFVYAYALSEDQTDFVLTFYSETQEQLIKIRSADGKKYLDSEKASQFDEQRKSDLEMIRSALLLYSSANASGTQDYVFPTESKYKTEIVPKYLTAVPKEPKNEQDYEYRVGQTFNSFTLKSPLDAPPSGYSGYLCNQEECRYY